MRDSGLAQRKTFQRFLPLTGWRRLLMETSALCSKLWRRIRRLPGSSELPAHAAICGTPSTFRASPAAAGPLFASAGADRTKPRAGRRPPQRAAPRRRSRCRGQAKPREAAGRFPGSPPLALKPSMQRPASSQGY